MTKLVGEFIAQRKKLHEIILNIADAEVTDNEEIDNAQIEIDDPNSNTNPPRPKSKWGKSATTFDDVDNMTELLEVLKIEAAGSTLEEVKIQNRPLRD